MIDDLSTLLGVIITKEGESNELDLSSFKRAHHRTSKLIRDEDK